MIRFIIAAIVLVIFFIITIPVWLILMLIGIWKPRAKQRGAQFFARNGFRIIAFIGGAKIKVVGRENVPKGESVLYTSNHQSILEAMVGYITVPEPMGFVAKIELKKAPFLKQWMDMVHCLFIDRGDLRQSLEVILAAAEELKSGTSIWICPEGTRNKDPEHVTTLEFKAGSFKPAERAGCAVVPVAVNGTWRLFERQMPRFKRTKVTVEFGKPIYIKQLDREEKKHLNETVRKQVEEMLAHAEY